MGKKLILVLTIFVFAVSTLTACGTNPGDVVNENNNVKQDLDFSTTDMEENRTEGDSVENQETLKPQATPEPTPENSAAVYSSELEVADDGSSILYEYNGDGFSFSKKWFDVEGNEIHQYMESLDGTIINILYREAGILYFIQWDYVDGSACREDYDENGELASTEVVSVDGRTSVTTFTDGSVVTSYYNEDGKTVEMVNVQADGYKSIFKFDGNGNKIEDENYWPDGSLHFHYAWTYHPNGKEKSYTRFIEDGSKMIFFYDEQEREIGTESYNADGSRGIFTYTEYAHSEGLSEKFFKKEYADGSCEIDIWDEEGIWTYYEYDAEGNLVYQYPER